MITGSIAEGENWLLESLTGQWWCYDPNNSPTTPRGPSPCSLCTISEMR